MGYDIGPKIGIEGEKAFRDAINSINTKIKTLSTEMKAAMSAYDANDKSVEKLTTKEKILTQQINAQIQKLNAMHDGLDAAREKYGENSDITQKWQQQVNRATEQLNNLERQLQENNDELEKAKQANSEEAKAQEAAAKAAEALARAQKEAADKIEKTSEQLQRSAQAMDSINKIALAVAAAFVGIGVAATKVGMDFEASMSNVQALSGATGEDLEELANKAKEMGASTSKSASEAADALGYMALAGWNNEQMLQGLEPILRMSEAANADLATTSDLVTDSMSALGVKTEDLNRYLDIVAKTQSSANTSALGMLEAYIGCGGTMRELGVSLEESASWIGVLANRGKKASEAGTAFNSILVNLTGGAGKASAAMETLGISAWNSKGKFIGIEGTLRKLKDALGECTDEQKALFTSAIGGKTQMDTLQALLDGLDKEYAGLKETVTDCDGALIQTAKTMQDNLKGSLTALGSAAEGAGIALYEKFAEPAKNAVDAATQKVSAFTQALSSGELDNALAGIGAAVTAAGIGLVGFNAALAVKDISNFAAAVRLGGEDLKKFTAATKAGEIAQKALNLVQSISPMGALALAVAAVGTGLALYVQMTRESTDHTYELLNGVREEAKAFDDLKQAQQDKYDAGMAEVDQAQALINEYKQLADANGEVKEGTEEYARAKALAAQINDVAPGAIESLDNEGQAYLRLADNIDLVIAKKRLQLALESHQEAYQAAVENKRQAVEKLNELDAARLATQEKLTDAEEKLRIRQDEASKRTVDALKLQLAGYDTEIEQQTQTIHGYYNEISNYQQLLALSESESTADIIAGIDKYENRVVEFTGANAEEVRKQMQTSQAYYEKLKELQEQGEEISDAEIETAKKAAEEQKKVYHDMINVLLDTSKDAVEINEETGGAIIQALADGALSRQETAYNAALSVKNLVNKALEQAQYDAAVSGGFLTEGFVKGILAKSDSVYNAGVTIAAQAITAVQKTIKQGSPSRITLESGLWFDAGMELGIKKGASKVEEAARKMSEDIIKAANEWVTDQKFYNNLAATDEEEFWTKMLDMSELKSEEISEVYKKLYTARANVSKEAYEESCKWIDNEKFYNRMSAQEEVESWERVVNRRNLLEREQLDAEKNLYTARQALLKEEQEAQKKVQDEQEKALQEYQKNIDSRVQALSSYAGIFDEIKKDADVSGKRLLENLQDQVTAFKDWQVDMETLAQKGVTGPLLEELKDLGPSAAAQIHALSTLTESELDEYAGLFEEKTALIAEQAAKDIPPITIPIDFSSTAQATGEGMQKSKEVAVAAGAAMMSAFQGIITNKLPIAMESGVKTIAEYAKGQWAQRYDVEDKSAQITENSRKTIQGYYGSFRDTGQYLVQGIAKGFRDGQDFLISAIQSTLQAAHAAAQKSQKIHSPSKLWAETGDYMAQGVGVGFVEQMHTVAKQIQDSIPVPKQIDTPHVAYEKMTEAVVNGVSSAMQFSNAGNVQNDSNRPVLNLKICFNDREFAECLFDPLQKVAKQRGIRIESY